MPAARRNCSRGAPLPLWPRGVDRARKGFVEGRVEESRVGIHRDVAIWRQAVAMLEIHHGPAEREIAASFDGDVDALSADDRRIDQEVHADGVMHRCGAEHRHGLADIVTLDTLADELRGGDAGRSLQFIEPGALLRRHHGLMRSVERHERDFVEARGEHDRSGFRIRPDVELGRWSDVAVVVGATHDHDLGHAFDEGRVRDEGSGDVGQRPHRHENDVLLRLSVRFDQEFDSAGPLFARSRGGQRQFRAVNLTL